MTVIWCMVPETGSTMDRIFCQFGLFFAFLPPYQSKNQNLKKMKKLPGDIITLHMCTINDNYMMYVSWDKEHDGQNFFVILDLFLPFHTTNNPKNQNFEIMKKQPRDIIILHMLTINENYMMYGSWDMDHGTQNFLSFWTIFFTFTPVITQKIKIFKTM